jgi:integrase
VIRPFLRAEFTGYLFSPAAAIADYNAKRRRKRETPMTPSQRARRPRRQPKRRPREHYDRDSYRRAIARACELAKVPHWHPHQLRHNYATRIRKEFGVEAARILLGHRSTAVTELYAEIDRGRVREIVSKVG